MKSRNSRGRRDWRCLGRQYIIGTWYRMLSRCVEEGCGRLMRTCLSSNKTKEFNEGKRTNRQVSSDGRAKYGEGEGGRGREKEGEGERAQEYLYLYVGRRKTGLRFWNQHCASLQGSTARRPWSEHLQIQHCWKREKILDAVS